MAEVRSAAVRAGAHRLFLKKAQEFARSMDRDLEGGDFHSAASAASHCVICACDAVLARHKGIRSRSQDHGAVLGLLGTVGLEGLSARVNQAGFVLSLKQVAECGDHEISAADAKEAVKRARRFLEWVEAAALA